MAIVVSMVLFSISIYIYLSGINLYTFKTVTRVEFHFKEYLAHIMIAIGFSGMMLSGVIFNNSLVV